MEKIKKKIEANTDLIMCVEEIPWYNRKGKKSRRLIAMCA